MSVTSSQIEGPRRLPVLTGVVCLALTASFVATHSASVIAQRERSEALEEASAYFIEQPHLVPSPDLEEYVGAARLDNHDQARRLQRDRRGAPPIPSGLTRRRQETLDGIMERARAPLETLAGRVHGLKPAQPSLETIFSHAAVHEVGLHFLVCLALLFWLGAMLERLWGGTRLFLFQGGAAAATGGAYVAMNPGSQVALIGASGVAASLLTAYAVNAAGAKRDGVYWSTVLIGSGVLVAPTMLGIEWSQVPPLGDVVDPGAAGWALASGVVYGIVGAACLWLLAASAENSAAGLTKSDRAVQTALSQAITAVEGGRLEKAFGRLRQAIREASEDRSIALQIWTVARRLGKQREAAAIILSVIRDEIRTDDFGAAVGHWLELSQSGCEFRAEPALLIRLAPLLAQERKEDAAVQALRRALEGARAGAVPSVASRLARAARELDPETSRDAAWLALGSRELELGERQELEELLAELEASFPSDSIRDDTPVAAPRPAPVRPADPAERSVRPPPLDLEFDDDDDVALPPDMLWELPPDAPEPELASTRSDGFRSDAIEVEDLNAAQAPETAASLVPGSDRVVEAMEAILVELGPRQLRVELPGKGKRTVNLARVDAVGCGVVDGIGDGPVVLIDLALNHCAGSSVALKVVRLRADQFDARNLGASRGDASEVDALRGVLAHLIGASDATPLPDPMSARGLPFSRYNSLAQYHREVFGARAK